MRELQDKVSMMVNKQTNRWDLKPKAAACTMPKSTNHPSIYEKPIKRFTSRDIIRVSDLNVNMNQTRLMLEYHAQQYDKDEIFHRGEIQRIQHIADVLNFIENGIGELIDDDDNNKAIEVTEERSFSGSPTRINGMCTTSSLYKFLSEQDSECLLSFQEALKLRLDTVVIFGTYIKDMTMHARYECEEMIFSILNDKNHVDKANLIRKLDYEFFAEKQQFPFFL